MLPNKGDDLHRAAAIGGDAPDILPGHPENQGIEVRLPHSAPMGVGV